MIDRRVCLRGPCKNPREYFDATIAKEYRDGLYEPICIKQSK